MGDKWMKVAIYFYHNFLKILILKEHEIKSLFGDVELCFEASLNPLTAKLFTLNFHPHKVVSRWRDPQLQVNENYSDLTKWRSIILKSY